MFAYCNNDPINCADPTGNVPWIVVCIGIGVVVSGTVEALGEYFSGGTPKEIGRAAIKGVAKSLLSAISPELAVACAAYELTETFLECTSNGYSQGETIGALCHTLLSQYAWPSCGDIGADIAVTATFGFAKDLILTVANVSIEVNNVNTDNHRTGTYVIGSMVCVGACAGGGCGADSIWFNFEGRAGLWTLGFRM